MNREWTTEEVQKSFLDEVTNRFVKDNEDWKETYKDEDPGDTNEWQDFQSCVFSFRDNSVTVRVPCPVSPDFFKYFDATEVAWTIPRVTAEDNEIVIDVFLIDYWDDERHDKWIEEHNKP